MTEILAARNPDAELVEEWTRGRLPRTTHAYLSDLRLIAVSHECGSVAEFLRMFLGGTAAQANRLVINYRNSELARGLKPASVNRRLATLRSLVKFAQVTGRCEWSIAVQGVKREPSKPKAVPWSVFLALIEKAPDARLRAALGLMGYAGLRISEAVGLRLEDFDAAAGTVSVLGKGRRVREPVTLAPVVVGYLVSWVAERGSEPGPLFGWTEPTQLRRAVKALGEAMGVAGLRPHSFRRCAVTRALDVTNGDIRSVMKFSRHSSPELVALYDDQRADVAGEIAKRVAESS